MHKYDKVYIYISSLPLPPLLLPVLFTLNFSW